MPYYMIGGGVSRGRGDCGRGHPDRYSVAVRLPGDLGKGEKNGGVGKEKIDWGYLWEGWRIDII